VTEDLDAPLCIVRSGNQIGEAPFWDDAQQRLLWCDHATGLVHEARREGNEWRETSRRQLDRAVAAVIPRVQGGYVVASGIEILLMDEQGNLDLLARLDEDPALIRLNDAKCDASGRFWATTLATDFESRAGLYRIDADGCVRAEFRGLRLGNGIAWSPDADTIYIVDSLDRTILRADFNLDSGSVGHPRPLVTFALGEGAPNGLTVDDEGGLWVALTGGGEVRQYSENGQFLARLALPIGGPTSCAFGGENRDVLFVTSRSGRMPKFAASLLGIPEAMMESTSEEAGGLWIARPGVSGPKGSLFDK
jgi:sugar lactone lactonase YvrE